MRPLAVLLSLFSIDANDRLSTQPPKQVQQTKTARMRALRQVCQHDLPIVSAPFRTEFRYFYKIVSRRLRTVLRALDKMSTSAERCFKAKVAILGSGPAAHTAAIYCARAELNPVLFEGDGTEGLNIGGQLTTTHLVENFPGFPDGVGGVELTDLLRKQSEKFGTRILSETVNYVEFSEKPYLCFTNYRRVDADSVIIATGAKARKLTFPGSDEENGYWNKGISACAVCDGPLPIFRDKPLAVVGGGDSAMEEAMFLTKFGSIVYVIHRRDELRANRLLQTKAMENKKIKFLWSTVIAAAHGNDAGF